jgi:hypothetical protein
MLGGSSVRKILTIVEETHVEENRALERPTRKAAAVVVVKNPFAGRYVEDLSPLYDLGEQLAGLLVTKALGALGIKPEEAKEKVEGYGKGAIVGTEGEMEHPHAILHPKFGAPVRRALGGVNYCKAIIPSTCKRGGPGTQIDMPIVFKREVWVVSHFDTMTVSVPDAPQDDEIVVALALTESGRPLARTAGLQKNQVVGLDGNR